MPQGDRVTVQQYPFVCAAGGVNLTPTPHNPRREYLLIQNNGINSLNVQFNKSTTMNPANYSIAGGSEKEWDEKIPMGSINLSSTLGTFGTIIEGLPRDGLS